MAAMLAMRAASAAAAVVVGKHGTATLSAATLAPEEKIVFDWALLGRAMPMVGSLGNSTQILSRAAVPPDAESLAPLARPHQGLSSRRIGLLGGGCQPCLSS